MAEEHTRLSSLVNGRIQLPPLILKDQASEPYDLRTLGTGNRDFSILVELRRLHQTRHAAEGVRTRDSTRTSQPDEPVRCRLIREMNAVLRRDQVRAAGTGQDRKLRWHAPTPGATDLDPGNRQPVPVLTGNSANAATAAVSRARKVSSSCSGQSFRTILMNI